eukprot:TRINITY_DN5216_c0_g1_i1.p1 TRINITY_DN5216_c0_g1~~TRINITY_DN5216_c0_g1_i1.p1  ORF type:complete len:251 (+),score=65.70 TRINITY_DN5216_c0_g1_i1:96-755(+)
MGRAGRSRRMAESSLGHHETDHPPELPELPTLVTSTSWRAESGGAHPIISPRNMGTATRSFRAQFAAKRGPINTQEETETEETPVANKEAPVATQQTPILVTNQDADSDVEEFNLDDTIDDFEGDQGLFGCDKDFVKLISQLAQSHCQRDWEALPRRSRNQFEKQINAKLLRYKESFLEDYAGQIEKMKQSQRADSSASLVHQASAPRLDKKCVFYFFF